MSTVPGDWPPLEGARLTVRQGDSAAVEIVFGPSPRVIADAARRLDMVLLRATGVVLPEREWAFEEWSV